MHKILITAASLALGGFVASAQAHQVWLEQPEGQSAAILRFGEFGENLREASPGLLDKFGKPVATLLSPHGDRSADAGKAADGFALPFGAAEGESIVAQDAAYPLYTFKRADKESRGWYYPAARLVTSLAAQQPRLVFDLVPTGKPGEFKVFLKGRAQAMAKVALVTQSGWAKEAHSDPQGLVGFDMPWQGTYVAEASYTDRTGGERAAGQGPEAYDSVSYVTSLTYVKPDGLQPLAAGKAAAPNK